MDPGEECDDGDQDDDNECGNDCKLPECGDYEEEGDEECDDGKNGDQDDGCTDKCMKPACDDGWTQASLKEQCDAGPENADDADCTAMCKNASCGDGLHNKSQSSTEECDDGAANADDGDCTAMCKNALCGDGLHNNSQSSTEECDDGGANADDAACTTGCKVAVCGDMLIQKGVEACDDGVNDGQYGGCAVGCATAAPSCGDTIVDAEFGEECDGDAACLPNKCKYAKSCLDYKMADSRSMSGTYLIRRDGVAEPIQVWCAMDDSVSDGDGGYTFLKIDVDSDTNDFAYSAMQAEAECKKYGMKLLIPRSVAHLTAAYGVATTMNIAPVGGGTVPANSDYLRILGIYPVVVGSSCVDKALNSVDCPQWAASDKQVYWVSAVPVGSGEPDPDGACAGCSMNYTWEMNGTVKKYTALSAPGGTSLRFMCDTGDKIP